MVIRLITLVLLLCTSNSLMVNAQNFERFSNKEGFNQNTINDITQDKYGFLWIGTPNGLIKYDGYEFETYTSQSKTNGNISSNNLTCVYNDTRGVLWLGTNVGMNLYIPWLERFYTVPLLSKMEISKITPGPNGGIWFSGENQLYYCHLTSPEKGTLSVSENLLTEYPNILTINDFTFVNDNEIILATSEGLKKIVLEQDTIKQNFSIETLVDFERFSNINITCVKSIKNIFWIGTGDRILKTTLEENRVHVLKTINHTDITEASNSKLAINTIFEAINGDVWIGTKNKHQRYFI